MDQRQRQMIMQAGNWSVEPHDDALEFRRWFSMAEYTR